MSESVTCSVNGCDLRSRKIPRPCLELGYYGPWSPEDGPRYYSRLVGVEVSGVYDGVLYWQCPDCGAAWHRFPAIDWLHGTARPYIDRANASVTTTNQSRGQA